MDSQIVVIKKYGNRRLYDSTHSCYVNLDEVAEMVRHGRDVHVVDAVTGEDLTRGVLTQIIVEQAKGDDAAFPIDVLRQMVAASGRVTNDAAQKYMKAVFDMYQNAYRVVSPIVPPNPGPRPGSTSHAAGPAPAPREQEGEVAALKKRLEELESLVSGIRSKPGTRKRSRKRR